MPRLIHGCAGDGAVEHHHRVNDPPSPAQECLRVRENPGQVFRTEDLQLGHDLTELFQWLADELAVESSGVPYTILRPPAFMQNFSEGLRWDESLVEGIRERDEIAHPGGDGVVSYVSTEDIAAIAATALTEDGHGDKAYAPMGPEPLTLTQVAEHISWVAGRRIRYVETDRTPMRDALLAAGTPPETAELNSQLHFHAFSSGAMGVLNDDVLDVTGRPPVSFAEFAVGAAAAWRR
jgi:NmrA-like family